MAAVVAALPVWAGSPVVGQEAPDTNDGDWIEDKPIEGSVRALRGDVIVLLFWDVMDLQSARSMKPVTALAKPEDGVHLLSFTRAANSELVLDRLRLAQIDHLAVNTDGAAQWQPDYRPCVFVVGVDGTVKYAGGIDDPKLAAAVREEAKKVKYPGLGRAEFDKGVKGALDRYKRRDLAAARKEAQKVSDDPKASEAARADAADLVQRLARIARPF